MVPPIAAPATDE
ncbi:hypothetical protein BMF94_5371 [Rhodotorula taiwanensis]|uniref:Uncharacterized protein n=1 Tax=Rhodotorula taiwanensis TaxID=741276 RepID=A0A2S5B4A0_9BASI|nr:hypothetical protein BMF94_5371 [Rhodotorula taiwanensis]